MNKVWSCLDFIPQWTSLFSYINGCATYGITLPYGWIVTSNESSYNFYAITIYLILYIWNVFVMMQIK